MHSKKPKAFFESEEKMIAYLCSKERNAGIGRVGILAGHFMLGYDAKCDTLLPLIPEEENSLKGLAEIEGGIFPMRSFIMGIKSIIKYKTQNINSRIIILVNDHQFVEKNTPAELRQQVVNRGGELRKKFYSELNSVPRSFMMILQENNFTVADCILNNNSKERNDQDILPADTYCFSEQVLQRRFKRHTAEEYVEKNKFYVLNGPKGKEVRFKSLKHKGDYCLLGSGQSGCTGLALEIILEIATRNMDEIILILPNECADSVNYAAEIALNLLEKRIRITLIYNLHDHEDHIIVEEHQFIV